MTNVAVELDFDEEIQSVSHIRIPNAETLAAIAEAEQLSRDPNTKRYAHFSELLEEVLSGV